MIRRWFTKALLCIASSILIFSVDSNASVVPVDNDLWAGGIVDSDDNSMPCCNPEALKKFLETYDEQSNIDILDKEIPHFRIQGLELPSDIQDYAYNVCSELGIDWYYPTFICQIFQESGFNQYSVSNGLDYGYCQLRILYHEYFKSLVGHPEWDLINDPYANIYVGCYLMKCNLQDSDWSVHDALQKYFNSGNDYLNKQYADTVLSWTPYLERTN